MAQLPSLQPPICLAKDLVLAPKPAFFGSGACSWPCPRPGWRLVSQGPVLPLRATDVPPYFPVWKTETLVEFDAQFFDPPRRLSLALPD